MQPLETAENRGLTILPQKSCKAATGRTGSNDQEVGLKHR